MPKLNSNNTGIRTGKYDSKFESLFAKSLVNTGFTWIYNSRIKNGEAFTYKIEKKYYPDFVINPGEDGEFYIELKGWFKPTDRTKMLAVKESNPNLDIRLVFQNDNWLTKNKKQRYSDWANKHGFKYSVGSIPKEWISNK